MFNRFDRRALCLIDGFFEGFYYGLFQQKLEKCGNRKIKACLKIKRVK